MLQSEMSSTPIYNEKQHKLLSLDDAKNIINDVECIPAYKLFKQRYVKIFNEILILHLLSFVLSNERTNSIKVAFFSEPEEFAELFCRELRRNDWKCEIIHSDENPVIKIDLQDVYSK